MFMSFANKFDVLCTRLIRVGTDNMTLVYSHCPSYDPYINNDPGFISGLISDLHYAQEQLFITRQASEEELKTNEKLRRDIRRITIIDDRENNSLKAALNQARSERDLWSERFKNTKSLLQKKTTELNIASGVIVKQQAVIFNNDDKSSAPMILGRDETVRAMIRLIADLRKELQSEKESKHQLLQMLVSREAMLSRVWNRTRIATKMLTIAIHHNDSRHSFISVCQKLCGELHAIFRSYK